jgi:integrase
MTNRDQSLCSCALNAWHLIENCSREHLPDWVLRSTLNAIRDGTPPRAAQRPSAHFLFSLSKQDLIQRLQDSRFHREIAAQALFYLSHQERLAARHPTWQERASLAARRWLLYCFDVGKELSPRDIRTTLRDSDTLLRSFLRIHGERFAQVSHHVTRETIERNTHDMIALVCQTPILSGKSAADVSDWQDEEPFADGKLRDPSRSGGDEDVFLARRFAAATGSYSLDYSSFPTAIAIVRRIAKDFTASTHTNESSLNAIKLCLGLSIYFGIPWRDMLFARIARDAGPSQPGDSPFSIASAELTILPGHHYYPLGAMAFDQTDIRLPLPPELCALASILMSVTTPGDALHDLIGSDPSDRIRSYLTRVITLSKTSRRDLASGLHLPFVTLAIDRLGEAPTVISLLRCNPLPTLRGECAYLVEPKQAIVATLIRIQNAIRSHAELDPFALTNPYKDNIERAGSLQLYPVEFYDGLRRKVEQADDWNSIVACTELVLRGFGKRPLNDHLNPAAILMHFPIPHLLFADKLVSGVSRRRFVPMDECLFELARASEFAFGTLESLPYVYENTMRFFADLPLDERTRINDQIFRDERRHCGRSSFYNALRGAGASQLILNFAFGHGATLTQWNGSLGTRSPRALLEELKTYIQRLIADFKLGPSILLLTSKLRNLPDRRVTFSRLVKPPNIIDESLPERTSPLFTAGLSRAEMSLHSQAIKQLFSPKLKSDQSHLLIALALEVGLPPENLLRFYYASDVLVRSGEFVFAKASVWHSDFGGLSFMPIKLCRHSEQHKFASIRILSERIRSKDSGVNVFWRCQSDIERQAVRNLVGRAFLRLIGAPRFAGETLGGEDGWRMLCRCAAHTGIWNFGGAIQASLEGRERSLGLNNVAFLDVIEHLGGSRDVKLLDGSPFALELPPSREDRSAKKRSALNRLGAVKVRGPKPKSNFASPAVQFQNWRPEDWEWFLSKWLPLVTTSEIEAFLKSAGVNSRATHKLAIILSQRFEARGYSVESERLQWPPSPGVIWNESQNHQISGSSDASVESEISLLCVLLLTSGCRPGELYGLTSDDVHIFGEDVFLIVRRGKTERASRTLSIRSLCSDQSLCDEVVAAMKWRLSTIGPSQSDTLWPALSSTYKFRMGQQGFNARRGKASSRCKLDGRRVTPLVRKRLRLSIGDLRLYDLRHLAIICFHCETLSDHERKNELYSLITSSRQMGHASLITDIGSYLGTAFVAAATGDLDISNSFSMASVHPKSLGNEFWREFLVLRTLAKIDTKSLEDFEQAVDLFVASMSAVPEVDNCFIYRVSAAAKSLPPALKLPTSILTLIKGDQLPLEVNTHLLIEMMKLRRSFAIPSELKAQWKIVHACAQKSGFSFRYFGDRRPNNDSGVIVDPCLNL